MRTIKIDRQHAICGIRTCRETVPKISRLIQVWCAKYGYSITLKIGSCTITDHDGHKLSNDKLNNNSVVKQKITI